jgi:hypothetical protein
MITRRQGEDLEIDFFRGTVIIGHAFNTGTKKKIQLQVYIADYTQHIELVSFNEAYLWIVEKLQENIILEV